MKSRRRHELRTNELADALGRLIQRLRPHGRTVAVGAALVVVLLAVLVAVPVMRSRAADRAAEAFSLAVRAGTTDALRLYLERFADAPQAPTARLLLADRLLWEASGAEGDEREKKRAEAEALYADLAQAGGPVEPMARVGLALVALDGGRLDEGRKALEAVVQRWPQSVAATVARAHLEALAGYEPVAFSDEPLEEAETEEGAASKEGTPPAEGGEPSPAQQGEAAPKEGGAAPKEGKAPAEKGGEVPPKEGEAPTKSAPKAESGKSTKSGSPPKPAAGGGTAAPAPAGGAPEPAPAPKQGPAAPKKGAAQPVG